MKRIKPQSAGILVYRRRPAGIEVLLAHPGGPFWAKKDAGAWSVPKGEVAEGEEALSAARREFEEETGQALPGPFHDLGEVEQKAGKRVHAFACEADIDAAACRSNSVTVEFPRGSGRQITFPEVDRCEWFGVSEAKRRLNPAQIAFLNRLEALLGE